MTDGVGKKIVEALKMQSGEDFNANNTTNNNVGMDNMVNSEETSVSENFDNTFDFSNDGFEDVQPEIQPAQSQVAPQQSFFNEQPILTPEMPKVSVPQSSDEFEIPSNVAVLKQLIAKLPAGVSKQTGAMIIKQTMEALGISMRSVLQEAQQVQENLNMSSRECQTSILEYRKQINILEQQAQKYQRQYASLNDIISLFVQTNF